MVAYRMEKVNSLIKEELSLIIRFKAKDLRIRNFVTVTEVDTTRDFFQSKVFVTIFDPQGKNSDSWKQEILKALQKAGGYFRSLVSKAMNTKHTPQFMFEIDAGAEKGQRILSLIDSLNISEESDILAEGSDNSSDERSPDEV